MYQVAQSAPQKDFVTFSPGDFLCLIFSGEVEIVKPWSNVIEAAYEGRN